MSEKLKPCPFCGGKKLYKKYYNTILIFEIVCVNCNSKTYFTDRKDEGSAIAAWNKRVKED